MKPLALVVSASTDEPTWGPVETALSRAGFDTVVFQADKVAAGSKSFECVLGSGTASMTLDGRTFDPSEISAAWWRKPHWLWLTRSDSLRKRSIEHEINRLQQTLWASVPTSSWLNAPIAMRDATSLSLQMAVASSVSLATPDTLVTNDWADVHAFAKNRAIAFKATDGIFESSDGPSQTLFTRRLQPDELVALESDVMPYPGIFQEFVDKGREWRVTVVGEHVFSASIYTESGRAQMDWRREQLTSQVRFCDEELPAEVASKCRAVTRGLGLRYSAIDLVERADGEFVFLEANPNGQFLWLEEQLGLPITAAIADELIRIARG